MSAFTDEKIDEYLKDAPLSASEAAIMSGSFRLIALQLKSERDSLAKDLASEKEFRLKDLDERTEEKALHNKQIKEHKEYIQTLERERDEARKEAVWYRDELLELHEFAYPGDDHYQFYADHVLPWEQPTQDEKEEGRK